MTSERRGRLIAVEGLDGAGSSTQAALLAGWLRERGIDALETREPTGGAFGLLIRRILAGEERASPATLALAFAADRLDHLDGAGGLRAALDAGRWAVSDRYVLSSLAYQASEGLPLDWLREINRFAPPPDLTVFVDTEPEVCMQRIAERGADRERFESLQRLQAIRAQYQACLDDRTFTGTVLKVDGNGTRDAVFAALRAGLEGWLRDTGAG